MRLNRKPAAPGRPLRPGLRLAVAGLALALLLAPAAAGAQGSAVYFITNVSAAEFPTVRFDVRAIDLANVPLPSLNTTNLAVYENGLLVPPPEVTPHTDGPVNYVFVLDLGRQSNYQNYGLNNIRDAMTTLVSGGYFVDGVDTVQVFARQNINSDQTSVLLAPTASGADFNNWAANFNFQRSNGPTKGLLAIEDALAQLIEQDAPPGAETTAIIFITRLIEEPRAAVAVPAAESAAQLAHNQYTSVHVFHTDTGRSGKDPLETLAAGGDGLYIHLLRNQVGTLAAEVYRAIHAQRNWYSVAYRSQLGTSGTRVITINSAEAPAAGAAGRYDVAVEPPLVAIVEPNPGSVLRREPVLGADGVTYFYPEATVAVRAAVTWPDGTLPRGLARAELLADGVVQASTDLAPDDTEVVFDWDISNFVNLGLNSAHLQVRVFDELQVEGVGEADLSVEVIPMPTPVPQDPVATRIREITDAVSPLWIILPLGLVGLLFALVLSGLIFFLTRPEQTRTKMLGDIRNTLLGGGPRGKQRVLATLKVIDGPKAWVGETINIAKEKTTLGRNPQAVDIPFYRDEESSISRVHCTIQLDRNSFVLTDHGSTSGTRVNGEWLKPNDPVVLRDGDEIVMGDLTQRGVKLRFSYLPDKTELPVAAPQQAPAAPERQAEKTMWDGFKWDEDKWNEDQ
jgi:hypothetical protein